LKKELADFLKEYLKKPWFVLIIIIALTLVTMFFPSYFADLVLIVSAFILSDLSANVIVRGGNGLAQIRPLGTKIQYEGYVLIVFFSSIVITSLGVDFASQELTSFALSLLSNPSGAIVFAVFLGFLVYGDMRIRFYWRSKTTQ
jgi:hypothetical protein